MHRNYIFSFLLACFIGIGCGSEAPQQKNIAPTIVKTHDEWKRVLSPNAYSIMVNKKTEVKHNNAYNKEQRNGVYLSAATQQVLFSSESKFESNTGWPAFSQPIDRDLIIIREDRSNGMLRNEVIEASTGLHLGHVFDDGPIEQGGKRYCINSGALVFKLIP